MTRRVASVWELALLQRQIDELLASLAQAPGPAPGGWTPLVDVLDRADHYVVRVDLPGVPAGGIELKLHERELQIAGAKPSQQEGCHRRYHHMERGCGAFSLVVTLPGIVDPARCAATLRAGVLEVILPRPAERRKTHFTIAVIEEEL
ncbi:MAG: Hsp20/alpha crystallin family protein [Acidobacteriota bacterium]